MTDNQPLTIEISIIIPAYNAADTIFACVRALQTQTIPRGRYEIIVVDDGSADDTAQRAADAGARVIRQENAGAAAARNRGAQAAQGEILLFTDSDCIPAPDWVAQMVAPFADQSVTGAKGVYKTEQSGFTPRFVQQEYQDKYDGMAQLPQIDFVDTYSAAYRRDIFLAMGGFDTNFPGASVEDQEFSFRLAEAGYRLVFVPQAMVFHRHDPALTDYARRKFFIGYWKNLVVRRHPDKIARDSHTPQVLKLQMAFAALGSGMFALAILFRRAWLAGASLASWLALVFSGVPFYRKIWRRDPAVLAVAPVMLVVRAVSLGAGFAWGWLKLTVSGRLE